MNTHTEKQQETKTQSVANTIIQKQDTEGMVFQFEDNRPEATTQLKLQEITNAYGKQEDLKSSDTSPIQRKKGRGKKANWNQKQIDQNERLFERRDARQAGYARARERERLLRIQQNQQEAALVASMKATQRLAFQGFPQAIQAGMMRLYHRGFQLQNSSGRAVFNMPGDFNNCKAAARSIVGDLGHNLEDGISQNPLGAIKERYMVNWQGIRVIIRNFSSNAAILGTIEFQTAPVVFEFKYQ